MIRISNIGELLTTYFELFALQNVTISTTRLPRSASDGGVKTTGSELTFQESVDLGICCDVKNRWTSHIRERDEPFFLASRLRWAWLESLAASAASVEAAVLPLLVTG
jgi:hypothetical protein